MRIPLAALEPWDVVCHAYETFRLLMTLLRCRNWSGAPAPQEGQALAWVEASRLAAFPMPAADRPLVRRLASTLAR